MSKHRWLKATFEHTTAKRVYDATERFTPEGGCQGEGVVVYFTDAPAADIQHAIWELNHGACCDVVEIDEQAADKYL